MANLEFCDTHNMVAYLKKPEGSEGFHQIVDSLNASHIRYALTINPTIYVSYIKQFWQTATAITLDNEEIKITATIDGQVKTVTEASVRMHLQLADADGIGSGGSPRRQETILGDMPAQTRFKRLSKHPYDSPLPGVNTLGSDEGSMTLNELMVKTLEKTVKTNQARRKARIVVSDDEEDMEDSSKQGRKIAEIDQDPNISLVQHDAEIQGRHEHDTQFDFDFTAAEKVYTAKEDLSTAEPVSTAGPSVTTISTAEPVSTAGASDTTASPSAVKDKERQRIAIVHEAASSFNVEEWEDIQARIKADEELAQRLQAKEREKSTLKAIGSTERSSELEIILRFNSTEPTDNKEREIWVELKRLFKPDTDDELLKLQNHIHDLTWRLYDSCGVHHVSTEDVIDVYMMVEKEYPLSRGVLTLMLVAKLLVEQDNEMSIELLRKIFMHVKRTRR
nr:hypothetical protein [Tanacetum cinerariifolium]